MPQENVVSNSLKEELESSDSEECLLDMLGLTSLESLVVEESKHAEEPGNIPSLSEKNIKDLVQSHQLGLLYESEAICIFPQDFSISSEHMRRLTDELVWGGDRVQADRTYETIKVWKNGVIEHRRTLTRLENFVDGHEGWSDLCHNYLRKILSAVLGTEMVLYKEKLNLKPPGGSGFAPHLDSPSLRVALGPDGPQSFCTVMVAIDDMTIQNGCLRVSKGPWTESNHCEVVQPEQNGNPDAGGRAGAISTKVAEEMDFKDITCRGGTVVAFNGWAPHRSAANTSPFPRRAVFLTYNSKCEGDFHKQYYEKMEEMRRAWRESVGLAERQQRMEDEKLELEALKTIPNI